MHFFRYVVPVLLALACLTAFTGKVNNNLVAGATSAFLHIDSSQKNIDRFRVRTGEAKRFVNSHNYNDQFCFLIDMSVPSGKNRFFIYDLKNDSVIYSALVSHGICYGGEPGARFSNTNGSGCSSLGKYRIGNPYVGQWGYSYKLHGLENSNDNAYERTVVLHAHNNVPDIEVDDEIVQSLGCPMVSPTFFKTLKKTINNSTKPILLWIYN